MGGVLDFFRFLHHKKMGFKPHYKFFVFLPEALFYPQLHIFSKVFSFSLMIFI